MYVVYLDATYQKIQVQLAKEQEILGYLQDAKDARDKLDKLVSEYQSFPQNADERLNVMLPDSIDTVKLVVDINDAVEKMGMIMKAPTVSQGTLDPKGIVKYRETTVNFGVSTTYSGFRRFLRVLESSLALRDFSDVTFSASPTTASGGETNPEFIVYEYSVIIHTYSLK